MGEAIPMTFETETQKDGSEPGRQGLAENGFCVLVAQASGGVESDAIAGGAFGAAGKV